MSKLKVNTIEPASGGSVTVTGLALDGTGILSGSASGDAQGQIKINDVPAWSHNVMPFRWTA